MLITVINFFINRSSPWNFLSPDNVFVVAVDLGSRFFLVHYGICSRYILLLLTNHISAKEKLKFLIPITTLGRTCFNQFRLNLAPFRPFVSSLRIDHPKHESYLATVQCGLLYEAFTLQGYHIMKLFKFNHRKRCPNECIVAFRLNLMDDEYLKFRRITCED